MKKKSTKQKTNTKKNQAPKNTYNLDEYRNKKSTAPNPYGAPKSQSTTSNRYNPYDRVDTPRTTKNSKSNKSTKSVSTHQTSYTNTYQNTYQNVYQSNYATSKDDYYSGQYKQSMPKTPEVARQEIKQKNKISRKEAEQLRKKRKSKQRNKIILVALMIIVGVYGGIKVADHFIYPTVSYQVVRMGMIDNSEKVQGLIVRDEKVYTSTVDGNVHYLTGEGQRVKKDGEVSYISQDEVASQVMDEIDHVDSSIYNIQDKRENLSEYQTEIYNLNNHITTEIKDFYNSRSLEKTNSVYTLRKQLDRIVQTRTQLYVNEPTDRTENLQQNRLELSSKLNDYQNVVKAEEAGIVSYVIDGYEEALQTSEIEGINFEDYQKLLKGSNPNESNKSVDQTTKDTPIYKLIVNDTWQVVTYLDAEQAMKLKEGESYDLVFNQINNIRVRFKLSSKLEEEEKVKLIFTTSDQIVQFLPYRVVEFTIGENKAEGLKIPLTAIVEKNVLRIPKEYIVDQESQQGVMRKVGEVVEFVPINVQYTDDNSAYILQDLSNLSGIQINQTLSNPESGTNFTIKEVQAMQGVYTINGRYAKFKGIEIVLTNEGYAIIKENSELKEFDQIISNPKSIKEDQLLKSMNIQNE